MSCAEIRLQEKVNEIFESEYDMSVAKAGACVCVLEDGQLWMPTSPDKLHPQVAIKMIMETLMVELGMTPNHSLPESVGRKTCSGNLIRS